MMSSADVGYRDTILVTAADSVLQSRPDDLRAMLRAMSEASRIAREEPARAAAVKEIAKIPEELTLKIFEDITLRVRDFSEANFESYDRIARFLVDQKVLEQPIAYRPMLQNGFFKAS